MPSGDIQFSGYVYPIHEVVTSTTNRFERVYKKLEEFKRNVNSGIYPNILNFSYTVDKKFYSVIYEVRDLYFDSLYFITDNSETKLYSSFPLNIPNKEEIDEKRWRGIRHLEDTDLSDKEKIDKEIANLEWKKNSRHVDSEWKGILVVK